MDSRSRGNGMMVGLASFGVGESSIRGSIEGEKRKCQSIYCSNKLFLYK